MNGYSYEYTEQTLENGTKIKVRVYLHNNGEWRISDVLYKEKRKRTWKFMLSKLSEDYEYRYSENKRLHELNKFIEFVGDIKYLNSALREAYESIKPEYL